MTATAAPARAPARTRSSLAVVALLLVAGAVSDWWLVHPARLQPVGNRLELPTTVGQTVVLGMFAQPLAGPVEVLGAEPRVRSLPVGTTLRVLACRTGDAPLGGALGRAEDVCDAVSRPEGTVLRRFAAGGTYLVLEVTSSRPGAVEVDGLRVRYRDGFRRGSGDSGTVAVVVARP